MYTIDIAHTLHESLKTNINNNTITKKALKVNGTNIKHENTRSL